MSWRGWVVSAAGAPAELRELDETELPRRAVVVAVSHSAVNYKDALALSASAPVARRFPLVLGIDLAGSVLRSSDPRFAVGDPVLATGWGLGEEQHGGLATRAACEAEWLTPIPRGRDAAWAMALGTAGFTAWLAVERLRAAGLTPERGPIAVTGASGGVGGFALQLLAALGYTVHAISGKTELATRLRSDGAEEIHRPELLVSDKPLRSARFAGAVDTLGGAPLAGLLGLIQPLGAVAACGNAAGMPLPGSVAPFILRGISLIGIDSVRVPQEERRAAWAGLAEHLPEARIAHLVQDLDLTAAVEHAQTMIAGRSTGRCRIRC